MTDKPVTQSGLWSGSYILLLFGNFFTYLGFQMLVPTFTAYIKQGGGTDLIAGLAFSMATVAALIMRTVSGNAMDALGRKPLLMAGLCILIALNGSFFIFFSIAVILGLRFVQGLGWGMAGTALATVMSDIVPVERRGEGTGYFALSIVLATSLSIILGIWLMNYSGFMLTLTVSTVFFAIGLLLCQGISVAPILREANKEPGREPLWAALLEKRALFPAFLCFLHSVAFSGIMAFIMLFGAETGITNIGVFFIGHLLMIIISRPMAGRLFDLKGHSFVILPGAICMIAGLILLSYSHSIISLLTASIFYGLGFGTVQPSLHAWAINRSPGDRKGAANGTFLSSLDLGYTIGTMVMGAIASITSYAFMYRVSSLLLVAFIVIYGCELMKTKGREHLNA